MKKHTLLKILLRTISYVLVATLASGLTYWFYQGPTKLERLQTLINEKFIGQVDDTLLEDAAADAMVSALGDRWSYYIPASEYLSYTEQMNNSYVGIGITISVRADGAGFDILKVEPGSGAEEAGILAGDILTAVEGESAAELGTDGAAALIRGLEGTEVHVTVLRDGETLELMPQRRKLEVTAAAGRMLEDGVGCIKIVNFNQNCASQTITAIESLLDQGAQALIFDVRNNPGGYRDELVELLDYLLPEGPLFRSVDYSGKEQVDTSDASCIELPMAVLVNGSSYSAAEFFAAALEEYDWAVVAGEPTCGKGYFQTTYQLGDGSAVGLSVGKYTTPNGVSLAETGGLAPELQVEVDEQTAALIYAGTLADADDPQLQAALAAVKEP